MFDGFPKRLRAIRKKKGLTQTELGKIVGVDKCLISRYEKGYNTPRIDTLEWFCQALGVSSTELLGF